MPIALGPNTNGPASTMPALAKAAAVSPVNIPTPSLADAGQAGEQREAGEVTPMPVPDSPRARRIREAAAEMVKDEPGLSLAVALDRADALETMAEEREAMALLELEDNEHGCGDSLAVQYGNHGACCARCRGCGAPEWYD